MDVHYYPFWLVSVLALFALGGPPHLMNCLFVYRCVFALPLSLLHSFSNFRASPPPCRLSLVGFGGASCYLSLHYSRLVMSLPFVRRPLLVARLSRVFPLGFVFFYFPSAWFGLVFYALSSRGAMAARRTRRGLSALLLSVALLRPLWPGPGHCRPPLLSLLAAPVSLLCVLVGFRVSRVFFPFYYCARCFSSFAVLFLPICVFHDGCATVGPRALTPCLFPALCLRHLCPRSDLLRTSPWLDRSLQTAL